MKSKQKKEARNKTIDELKVLIADLQKELNSLSLDNAQKKLKNTSLISIKRRELAIVKTFLTEKQLLEKEG